MFDYRTFIKAKLGKMLLRYSRLSGLIQVAKTLMWLKSRVSARTLLLLS
jgi:hypothetical protein